MAGSHTTLFSAVFRQYLTITTSNNTREKASHRNNEGNINFHRVGLMRESSTNFALYGAVSVGIRKT
ncbi:unnamed protein product [Clavelina lepadiformis]|uniref:Uncharacterized protein n=1 Tax=Clavelina lepadiformis TaxID=159417 RepID=A0ABP0F346_CLALP